MVIGDTDEALTMVNIASSVGDAVIDSDIVK